MQTRIAPNYFKLLLTLEYTDKNMFNVKNQSLFRKILYISIFYFCKYFNHINIMIYNKYK